MADSSGEEFDERVINSAALLGTAVDDKALLEMTEKLVSVYLQSPNDAEVLAQTLLQVRGFFHKSGLSMDILRQFSVQVIRVVLRSRPAEYYDAMLNMAPSDDGPGGLGGPGDAEGHHAPTELILVPPPQAVTCQNFQDLVAEALCYRLRQITTFFQRRNPLVARGVRAPYLLSPAFEPRLCAVVRETIAPQMFQQKFLNGMAATRPWRQISSADLWRRPDLHADLEKILKAWNAVWKKLYRAEHARQYPLDQRLSPSEAHALTRDQQTLGELQHLLSGPEYALPKLSMGQIKIFQTLPTQFDRPVMEQVWKGLRQTYEQELDRRAYQEKARHGALRDAYLTALDVCGPALGEMLIALSFYSFPRLSLFWLEQFSHNLGSHRDERMHHVPQLIRFLEQEDTRRAAAREPDRNQAEMMASACAAEA